MTKILNNTGVYHQTNVYPHLANKFSDNDMMVLHDQCVHLVNDLQSIRKWFFPPMFSILDENMLLLNVCGALSIATESLLNLPYSTTLGITRLLAKFDAVLLRNCSVIGVNENLMDIYYTNSLTG